jgi:hypothetical protein
MTMKAEKTKRIEREFWALYNNHHNAVTQMESALVIRLEAMAEELDTSYDADDMRDSIEQEYMTSGTEDYLDELVSDVDVYTRIMEYTIEEALAEAA